MSETMSLTRVIRDIRSGQKRRYNPPDRPTAVWTGMDLLDGKPVAALTVIFQTTGCRWNNCAMCGYVYDSSRKTPSHEDLMKQFENALSRCRDEEVIVKIFTSGSFLDDGEIPDAARIEMLTRLGTDPRVKKVIAETRPEYVVPEIVSGCRTAFGKRFEVAMGLETSSDIIRRDCINKGFTFMDFIKASKIARQENTTTKAYLLLKPPFLSEGDAVSDIIKSINDASQFAGTISVNPCNIQKGTLIDEMYMRGDYRSPWLWSAVEVLKKGKEANPDIVLMSDPVGAGSSRGPHNCGKCDKDVAEAIRIFSLTQDTAVFDKIHCECKELWNKVVDLEGSTYGSFLIR